MEHQEGKGGEGLSSVPKTTLDPRRKLLQTQGVFSLAAGSLLLALFLASCGSDGTALPSHYEPHWESIGRHPVPQWYEDAKLGIFIHWGLYSVPGWATPTGELGKVDRSVWFKNNPYAEWYLNTLKIEGSPTRQYHLETYGDQFDYLDFIPIFQKEVKKWNPDEWAALFQQVGARYVVLTTKHHDGFTLWPSRVKNPHRKDDEQGSRRDLVGELTRAVRTHGMKMGLYYSGGLDWSFYELPITRSDQVRGTVPQTPDYAAYVDAHWRELIERYEPDILWNDISYPQLGEVRRIFADYYNRFPNGVINNRWGVEFADITTPEYKTYEEATAKKWEACRGISYSFGYNRTEGAEHMLSLDKLTDLLVDVVSKNGNLLLNVGPRADGTISPLQVERLKGLGEWLGTNGEAIFGTRPWARPEGKTTDGVPIRFTQKGGSLYAILLEDPKSSPLHLEGLSVKDGSNISLLGSEGTLEWLQEGDILVVTLPQRLVVSEAYTLKITPQPVNIPEQE